MTERTAPNPLQDLISGVGSDKISVTKSRRVAKRFLNPVFPFAQQDDPDGTFHFQKNQISNPNGEPIRGLQEGDPIPMYLRWYQAEVINHSARKRVLRFGRRTGKTLGMAAEAALFAVENDKSQVLILTPNESQIKVIFDDYLRPLLRVYRHKNTTEVGLEQINGDTPPPGHDLAITKDTQKPQEIVLTNGTTIRGMVITDSARGQSADFIIIDEADYADTEKLQAIVSPIMVSKPQTRALMSSTPTGRRDSYFYKACNSNEWAEFKQDFRVLPHYSQELEDSIVEEAGGRDTNVFQQEYLAEWGTETSGVFNAQRLSESFVICPYIQVMESVDRRTRERVSKIAGLSGDRHHFMDYRMGAMPFEWGPSVGMKSLWRPGLPGVITMGTDWNDRAGMQTICIWWPPEDFLKQGKIKVSRFAYNGDEPITNGRAKDRHGDPIPFEVGRDNNDPGGKHDLSNVKGIVIWHGRLESGKFQWSTAANRVLSILSIPDFVDCWYVDAGYGEQVNNDIIGSMESGMYQTDGGTFLKNTSELNIPDPLLSNIRKFHPDLSFEETGKKYQPVWFSKPYEFQDGFSFMKRTDNTKDVLVGLTRREINQRRILIPYGEMSGYAKPDQLGEYTENQFNPATGEFEGEEVVERASDKDLIRETGAEEGSGERSFGGLIAQMRSFRVDGRSPTGKPRYAGDDHAIDAFMLAVLAYYENYRDATPENPARVDRTVNIDQAEALLEASATESSKTKRGDERNDRPPQKNGSFMHPNYTSTQEGMNRLMRGEDPNEVGTSLRDMIQQARDHFRKNGR